MHTIHEAVQISQSRFAKLIGVNLRTLQNWEQQSVTSPVLMEEMGFDERKAQRVLKTLLDFGLLRRVGRGPTTRYEVVRL